MKPPMGCVQLYLPTPNAVLELTLGDEPIGEFPTWILPFGEAEKRNQKKDRNRNSSQIIA